MALRRFLPALLVALASALGAWFLHSRRSLEGPLRIQVQVRMDGLPAEGLKTLVCDLLEIRGHWVVVEPPPGVGPPEGTQVLDLQGRWIGNHLSLDGRLGGHTLHRMEGPPLPAFALFSRQLHLAPPDETLVPPEPEAFAELVELMGGPRDAPREDLDHRAQSLVASHPRCASAREAWAFFTTRLMVEGTPPSLDAKQRCEQNMREALDACPGHPRLVATLAYFLTDSGRQREALELGLDALERRPQAPLVLGSLAYAGRTGGLLELADRALDRQAAVTGLPRVHTGLADNTRLYMGDLDRFEQGLPRVDVETIRVFYQGYARLLRKDPQGALAFFKQAEQPLHGTAIFLRLSAVYRLALEGRQAESLVALEQLENERVQVRVPDGEITFKVAEAFGYLGQPHRALEVMGKAAIQGFGCTPWYERSPFLAEARKLPAWPRLHQTLQERQQLLEQRFSPGLIPAS
ncbi:MAG TPA: hypothetical protein VJ483_04045 [Holophagaceae bacterium]|nr:hypothetical protein [Holophagaceae bacterium]